MATLKIERDTDPQNPRDWDNLGTMALFHRRYNLPNEDKLSNIEAQRIAHDSEYITLNVFGYDHGSLTVNTGGFSCPSDSGQLGIIYVSKSRLFLEYGWKKITKERRQKIETILRGEVATYDQYLQGDIWGFIAEYDDGSEDSCWGFYGSDPATNGMSDHFKIPLESFTTITEE